MKSLLYALIAGFVAMVATNEIVAFATGARVQARGLAASADEAPDADDSASDAYVQDMIDAQYEALMREANRDAVCRAD